MSDRIQLNIRLNKCPELYEAVKEKAVEERMSVNNFAIDALKAALGWDVKSSTPPRLRGELEEMLAEMLAPMQHRLEELEHRLGESKA